MFALEGGKKPNFFLIFLALAIFLFFAFKSCARAEEIDLSIIMQIESNGNPNAYNKQSGAIGLYQITPICLKEYNQVNGEKCFSSPFGIQGTERFEIRYLTISDLYNPIINERVAEWYLNIRIPQLLNYYHKPITIDNILWAYNAGIGNVIKGKMPRETRNYIKKYHELKRLR